ncbi:DNA ligase 4 [Escovopsis weberi]|uniref:DNA ligase 4 n=1 Tax=Escovopsis weberi TaxID=150374 RepID=A0A0M8N4H6_ESCWE|nr:DNA ligase 4 [Escovopsis weberi]
MDGEYCQIHIDISKGKEGFQIFSKGGKDSTEDRRALQEFVFDSLRIGQPSCPIKTECILEGELLVYSDQEQKVLPFHHIRNHVTRRGRLINADYDSRPRPGEHLMIVYYDILLLDGESLLNTKHSQRFELLKRTIHCSRGRAEIVPRQIIDTGHEFGASSLRNAFEKIIHAKGEGLVLKADLPYFNFNNKHLPFTGRCIKLKKEYIGNFGDVGDFAVVGAGFNPQKAKSYDIPNLKWTHFFIGCLDNREEVKRWGVKPKFTIVNEIELNATMIKAFIAHGGIESVPEAENDRTIFRRNRSIEVNASLFTAFSDPPIFDVRCFGFEKMADTGFWGLRFPTATKIHFDRDFTDAISFDELQELAEEATSAPEMEDSQENLKWITKLEAADPRGVAVDALTQETTTTGPSPSPGKFSPASASCPSTSRHHAATAN